MKLRNRELALPIIQGGMGIGVSLGGLAGAVAREGGMGVISAANPGYTKEYFWQDPDRANCESIFEEVSKAKEIAGGNGLIAINAMVAGKDYTALVKVAVEAGVDAIISGAGLPLELPAIAGKDVLLAPIVSSGKGASTICKSWLRRHGVLPDFIVLEGSEAGGHLGFKVDDLLSGNVKSLSELLAEVLTALQAYGNIPVFVAGGVYTGADVARYISEGAVGAQIATRFIATEECDASEGYKQMILKASQEEIRIVKSPVGMPGRALHTPLIEKVEAGQRVPPKTCTRCLIPCNPADTPYCITRALIEGVKGNREEGLFFCGSNAFRMDRMVSVKELMAELTEEWKKL